MAGVNVGIYLADLAGQIPNSPDQNRPAPPAEMASRAATIAQRLDELVPSVGIVRVEAGNSMTSSSGIASSKIMPSLWLAKRDRGGRDDVEDLGVRSRDVHATIVDGATNKLYVRPPRRYRRGFANRLAPRQVRTWHRLPCSQ